MVTVSATTCDVCGEDITDKTVNVTQIIFKGPNYYTLLKKWDLCAECGAPLLEELNRRRMERIDCPVPRL